MPRRRRFRSKRRRRLRRPRLRRRRRRGRRSMSIRRPLLGNSQAMTLKYVQFLNLDPINDTVPVTNVFRANSVFDPDFTGGGHQPRGFDQMAVLFNKYTVVGSKITASYMSDNTAGDKYIIGINLRSVSAEAGLLTTLTEEARANITTMGVLTPKRTLTKRFSPKKFFRVPSSMNDDEQQGSYHRRLPQASHTLLEGRLCQVYKHGPSRCGLRFTSHHHSIAHTTSVLPRLGCISRYLKPFWHRCYGHDSIRCGLHPSDSAG